MKNIFVLILVSMFLYSCESKEYYGTIIEKDSTNLVSANGVIGMRLGVKDSNGENHYFFISQEDSHYLNIGDTKHFKVENYLYDFTRSYFKDGEKIVIDGSVYDLVSFTDPVKNSNK